MSEPITEDKETEVDFKLADQQKEMTARLNKGKE